VGYGFGRLAGDPFSLCHQTEAGKSPEKMEVSGTLGRLGYKPNMGTSTNRGIKHDVTKG
jgi:hypothetical protein